MKRLFRRDEGATLILVLLIVVVLSVILSAVLSFADANLRGTVQLRVQTADNYAANAAANAAVRQYQNGAFACTSTSSPSSANLGSSGTPFYVPTSSIQGSLNAAATCVPDTVNGTAQIGTGAVTIDTTNTLGYTVLTVGTNAGQTYDTVCLSGGSVASNSFITTNGTLAVGLAASPNTCTGTTAQAGITVTAASNTGCNGLLNDSNAADFKPTPCTHDSTGVPQSTWGGYGTAPTAPITATNPAALCQKVGSTTYVAYRPGLYNDVSALTAPPVSGSNGCAGVVTFAWFIPGTYYFDFTSLNKNWVWPGTLVAGFPQDVNGNPLAALKNFDPTDTSTNNKNLLAAQLANVKSFPGSCADPATQSTYPGDEFVFGGSSTFDPGNSGKDEICATYSIGTQTAKNIPIAIYGVSRDVNGAMLNVTGGSVSPSTLCASPGTGCTTASLDSSSAPANSLIQQGDPNGKTSIFVHGYIYAPADPIKFPNRIKNSPGVLFGWGLVLRSLNISINGAAPNTPYLAFRPTLHQKFVTYYTIRYLNIWTCVASASPCATTGTPNVRVKIQDSIDSTTGAILSTKVLSWSEQR